MAVLSDIRFQSKRVARKALDVLEVTGSAEKSLDFILPGNPGTAIGERIDDVPVVGGTLRKGVNYGLSPLTLSAAFLPPLAVARGAGLGARLASEAIVGAGAGVIADEASEFGGERFGTTGAIVGGLLGGAAGGVGLSRAVRSRMALSGKMLPQIDQEIPETGLKLPEFDAGLKDTVDEDVPPLMREEFIAPNGMRAYKPDTLKLTDDLEAQRLGDLPDDYVPSKADLIERGRVVFKNSARQNTDEELVKIVRREAEYNQHSSSPRQRQLFDQWFSMGPQVDDIRESFLQADDDARLMYWEGRRLREALHQKYPEGYVTLYRGERTSDMGVNAPIFPSDFPVQSYAADPVDASSYFFTGQNVSDPKILEVKVPIDAVVAPGAQHESEFLVMMPSRIGSKEWADITGFPKDVEPGTTVKLVPLIVMDNPERPEIIGYYTPERARKLAPELMAEMGEPEFRYGVNWQDVNPKLDDTKLSYNLGDDLEADYTLVTGSDKLPPAVRGGAGDSFDQKLEDFKFLQETGHKPAKANYTPKAGEVADLKATQKAAESVNATLTQLDDGRWEIKNSFGQTFAGTPEELAQKYSLPIVYSKLPDIKGGASPVGDLVAFDPVRPGLTFTEHVNSIYQRTAKFLFGKGTPESAVATPLIRDYARIVAELSSQGNAFAAESRALMKSMGSVHNLAGVDFLVQNGGVANPQSQKFLDRFVGWADAYNKLLYQRGLIKEIEPDPLAHMKKVLGKNWNDKPVDEAVLEYTERIAQSVARNRLRELINDMGLTVGKGDGKVVPGIINKDLPPEIADVIAKVAKSRRAEGGVEHVIDSVNGLLRGMWATADASFFGIQGVLMLADNPARAGVAIKAAVGSLADSAFLGKFVEHFDDTRYGVRPTSVDWRRVGLQFSGELSEFTMPNTGIGGRVGTLPVVKHFNRLFTNSGDVYRLSWADSLYKPGMTDEEMRSVALGVNRATGYSRQAFGGSIGEAAFFAPRFMQSQFETVLSGVAGLAPGASKDKVVARNALLKLVGMGTGITFLLNEARGEDTILDPRDTNFMRIRNVMGSDISVFGPWDGLVRAMTEAVQGNPEYVLRTKASPALSIAWDLLSGEDFRGDDVYSAEYFKKVFLPISTRDIGQEQLPLVLGSFFGIKTTPLTQNEELDRKMQEADLDPNDPLDRRIYLADHPDDRPESNSESTLRANAIRDTHRSHINALDDQLKSNEISLVDWRESRKLAYTDERARLDEIIREGKSRGDKVKVKLIESYMNIYGEATDKAGQIDPDLFDRLEAEWINKNGQENHDYMQQFLITGKSEVEKQYINDLKELDRLGYFGMQRYEVQMSSLSGDDIDRHRDYVSAVRSADPEMAGLKFSTAAFLILDSKGLSAEEIYDIVNATESNWTSDYREFRAKNNKLLQWFNPNAIWETYQMATEKEPDLPKGGGSLPKIGGGRR